jgi:hypothetical protein
MAVQEEHCPQNGQSSPHKRSKSTILAHQMMQGVVFEEWWEVWAMDGEWRQAPGESCKKVTKLKAERGTR